MFYDPTQVLIEAYVRRGMHVADIGSGSGAYAIAAARIAGGDGRVYAVDVQRELLQRIRAAAQKEHLANVEAIWGDLERLGGSRLREGSLDMAIAANVLFQIKDKASFMMEMFRILKKSGRLILIDWEDSFGGLGPLPEFVVKKDDAAKLAEKSGFAVERELPVGDHHYGFLFKKKQ